MKKGFNIEFVENRDLTKTEASIVGQIIFQIYCEQEDQIAKIMIGPNGVLLVKLKNERSNAYYYTSDGVSYSCEKCL